MNVCTLMLEAMDDSGIWNNSDGKSFRKVNQGLTSLGELNIPDPNSLPTLPTKRSYDRKPGKVHF